MPRSSHHHRSLTAFLAVLVLLWSQLALAAHACPRMAGEAGHSTMAERMAAGVPCEGGAELADAAQSALCHQHCANAPESADTAPAPGPGPVALVQAWPAPVGLYLLPVMAWPAGPGAVQAAPRPPPSPIFLSTLRLRT